jgi:S1-C subfamily serine protease
MFRILLIVVVTALPRASYTQDYSSLFQGFSTSELTTSDKRFLQAALAFEGHYNGLLDGAWGQISRQALDEYSWQEFGTPAEEWHMAMLAFSLFDRVLERGWEVRYFNSVGLSFLFPTKTALVDEPTDNFVNWRDGRSSVSYSFGRHGQSVANNIHEYTINWHEVSTANLYTVRKNNFAVTSATKRNGSVLYTRSNFIDGAWSTVIISAQERDVSVLNAIAASITVGTAPSLMFTEGGRLDSAIRKVVAWIESEDGSSDVNSNKQASEPEDPPSSGSGTGFIVSAAGHVLTNAHVVQNCSSISVDGAPALLEDSSEEFDLAIIKVDINPRIPVAVFSSAPARLNSDVTVVGYPYAGLLGGLNVTRGSVSSLKGLGGSSMQMQITAPIQPGNSGGPVVSSQGKVVGVVVSKLDAIKVAGALGDIPQNVNFAVRGEIAKLYLSQNGIDPILNENRATLSPEQIAALVSDFTVFVECKR